MPLNALFWTGILIALAILGGVLIAFVRRSLRHTPQGDADQKGSLLEELRDLRKRGEITEEQFQAGRASVLGRAKGVRKVVRGEVHEDGTIKARPGFDLTGSPLPDAPPPGPPRGR